jgi:uncharacterized protein (DUF488 family)
MASSSLFTIGYEGTAMPEFLRTLEEAGVALLVDVRAVANSRRPGFSKNSLAANLETVGIGYRHLRALGTPAEGRAAARAGKHAEMHAVFRDHLALPEAQAALDELAALATTDAPVCLLCFEADPAHCHRMLVADALAPLVEFRLIHLRPGQEDPD